MSGTEDRIQARAIMWREGGKWRFHLCAPWWVIRDAAKEFQPGGLGVANWGVQESGTASMLLMPRDLDRELSATRERADRAEARVNELEAELEAARP